MTPAHPVGETRAGIPQRRYSAGLNQDGWLRVDTRSPFIQNDSYVTEQRFRPNQSFGQHECQAAATWRFAWRTEEANGIHFVAI